MSEPEDLFAGDAAPPEPGEDRDRRDKAQEGIENWDRNFNYANQRMKQNLGIENAALDDWRKRFRDDYLNQMKAGSLRAQGDMRADASRGGMNPALLRGAGQAAGNVAAQNTMAMDAMKAQMSLADSLAAYDQSQRAANLNLAMHGMYGTLDNAKLAAALNDIVGGHRDLNDADQRTSEQINSVYTGLGV